jgi:hypothetical protein
VVQNVHAGVAQLVERHPSKVDVAGSSPVSRSIDRNAPMKGAEKRSGVTRGRDREMSRMRRFAKEIQG